MMSTNPAALDQITSLDGLYGVFEQLSVEGGWHRPAGPALWPEPRKTLLPHVWHYAELKGVMNRREEFLFTGRVFSGMREGGYYVSLGGYRRQFTNLLGFIPFPGTLNLRLVSSAQIEQKRLLRSMTGIFIEGFEDRARSYGPARCFRARIGETQKGAALVIERTHYDDTVLELISPVNLRRELKLKDGDELSAAVHLE